MSTTDISEAIDNPTGVAAPAGSLDGRELYRVWACDNQVYGPIPLPILTEWIRDSRVFRDTWLYVESSKGWYQAETLDEIKDLFSPGEDTMFLKKQQVDHTGIDP